MTIYYLLFDNLTIYYLTILHFSISCLSLFAIQPASQAPGSRLRLAFRWPSPPFASLRSAFVSLRPVCCVVNATSRRSFRSFLSLPPSPSARLFALQRYNILLRIENRPLNFIASPPLCRPPFSSKNLDTKEPREAPPPASPPTAKTTKACLVSHQGTLLLQTPHVEFPHSAPSFSLKTSLNFTANHNKPPLSLPFATNPRPPTI